MSSKAFNLSYQGAEEHSYALENRPLFNPLTR